MFQSFIVVLREGIEAFLIVAITIAYLRKTGQPHLLHAVYWGIAGSVATSAGLAYWLWTHEGANQPLWEGILGSITAILVATLVVHMWKVGPQFKQDMENQLARATKQAKSSASFLGIFLFTIVMISREGMEMMLLLFQIQDPRLLQGIALGVLGAMVIALLWEQFGYRINMRTFFQITSVFLLLFTIQIAGHAFHEFTEAGIFPNSEALHEASEAFSSSGVFGKLYSNVVFAGCGLWLIASWIFEIFSKRRELRAS